MTPKQDAEESPLQQLYMQWLMVASQKRSKRDEGKHDDDQTPPEKVTAEDLQQLEDLLELDIIRVGYPLLGLGPTPSFMSHEEYGVVTHPLDKKTMKKYGFTSGFKANDNHGLIGEGGKPLTGYYVTLNNMFSFVLGQLIDQQILEV